ncbi:methyl-accepting chemotaxis protein [Elusimicrobiota bacterium]
MIKQLKKTFRWGLQLKATVLVTVIIIFVAAILSVFFISRQNKLEFSVLEQRGATLIKNLSFNSEYGVLVQSESILNDLIKNLQMEKDIEYVIIQDQKGKVIASTKSGNEKIVITGTVNDKASKAKNVFIQPSLIKAANIYDISYPIETKEEEEMGFFEEASSSEKTAKKQKIGTARIGISLKKVNTLLLASLVLVIIVLSVIITNILISRLLMNIIITLLEAAKAIGRGDLKTQIDIKSNDELGELANAFKKMQVQLSTLAGQAQAIADGDLTKKVGFEGDLADSFNLMSDNLRELTQRINDTSISLDKYANEILSSAEEQSSAATQQASSTSEISTTIEELSQTAGEISKNSDIVAEIAEKGLKSAQTGKEAVDEAVIGSEAIKVSTLESAKRISDLGNRSQKISEVIGIISDISEQTKLLSLNASIEAARAGEAGKGFSVVAVEIRRLSESVSESVKEVKDIIKEIQSSINISVMSSEKMAKTVDQGLKQSQKVSESLERILESVERTAEFGKQIRHSTQQQKTASEQVAVTVKEIASVSKQTVDVANETSRTAKELTTLSNGLKEAISELKLEK